MKKTAKQPLQLRGIEWGVAVAMTLLIVIFHVQLLFHAGGLWRDEVNTIGMATMPRLGDIWTNLQYDSFPIVWFLVVRTWIGLGLADDFSLRILGLIVGLGIVAVFWFTAFRRSNSNRIPFFSLLLLGLSPAILQFGDSLRAYGFGLLLFLITYWRIWTFVESPSTRNVLVAGLAALLSVHTLYYNAVLLFAISCGGFAVALRRKNKKVFFCLLAIGVVSAISLAPYAAPMKSASDWNRIIRMPFFNWSWFWGKFCEATSFSGKLLVWPWVLIFLFAAATGVAMQWRPKIFAASDQEGDFSLFALVAMLVGSISYFLFLKMLRYPTQPWYYVALLGLIAAASDHLLSFVSRRRALRIATLFFLPLMIAVAVPQMWTVSQQRYTNADLVAAELEQRASEHDFILVSPWYYGVSFAHYYKGKAPFTTIPPVPFLKFHRYNFVKDHMLNPQQTAVVEPCLKGIAQALQTTNRVWIVGGVDFLEPGQQPPVLPAAPNSPYGWSDGVYLTAWSMQVGYFIQTHAQGAALVTAADTNSVNRFEALNLLNVQGAAKR